MAYNLNGKDITPMDVVAKGTGRAKYAEDFRADNMAFCKTLTSPIPHAKIKSIDTSEALKIPGVLGILTADDVPQFPPPALPILAKDEVYFCRRSDSGGCGGKRAGRHRRDRGD